MKNTKLRCSAKGCRTLTSNGLCTMHQNMKMPVIVPPDKEMKGQIIKIAVKKQDTQHCDSISMRADLNAIQESAEKLVRSNETPVFHEGENYGF